MEIIPERYPIRSRDKSKSDSQYMLGRLLRAIYGFQAIILEEFPIPEERLWLDFYLPHHGIAFEYQGLQHDKFNKFFHINKLGFLKSKTRDARKSEWCKINEIVLVPVRGNPSYEELVAMIKKERDV